MQNFQVISSETKHLGIVFDLKIDKIQYNSGNLGIREVILHNGGAVVLPITNDGKIMLIKQYRYPLNKVIWELPAGKLEKTENPDFAANRELEEETGFKTKNLVKLGEIATTPGFCSEILHLYLAENLQNGKLAREEGELGIEIFNFTITEIENMIKNGEIIDAKTIATIYFYQLKVKS